MATDEQITTSQFAIDFGREARRTSFDGHPLMASLRRLWDELIFVNAADPLRRLLNRGFATIVVVLVGFVVVLALTLFLVHDPALPVILLTSPVYFVAWWLNRRGTVYGIMLVVIWSTVAIVFGVEPTTYAGVNTPVPLIFIFPMVIATLFFRPQAGLWTLLILMTALGLRLAVSDVPSDAALRFMLIGTENLATFTAFLILGTSIFSRALRSAIAANEALQQLVTATFEAIVIHDNGSIVEVNPAFCRMAGFKRSEIVGKSILEFIGDDNREMVGQKLTAGHAEAYETSALRRDRTVFPIEMVGKPINYQGRAVQIIAMHNIAERKLAETQRLELALAKQKAELQTEFLNTISHDLKTPLAVIDTSLYLLEKDTNVENRQPRLQQIKRQSERLGKLIQDIMAVNRMETLPAANFQPIDVNALLTKIQKQFDFTIEKQHLTVELNLDDRLPALPASVEELERALTNLVENALRYTPMGGTITIRTLAQANQMVIEVQDTGIGISPADLPHIFEQFYRADKAKATDVSGNGLGLAIVKKIIEMHHGSIEVESQLEKGSTFRIRLPLLDTKI
jgi:PAS domain S-box-containing protein